MCVFKKKNNRSFSCRRKQAGNSSNPAPPCFPATDILVAFQLFLCIIGVQLTILATCFGVSAPLGCVRKNDNFGLMTFK